MLVGATEVVPPRDVAVAVSDVDEAVLVDERVDLSDDVEPVDETDDERVVWLQSGVDRPSEDAVVWVPGRVSASASSTCRECSSLLQQPPMWGGCTYLISRFAQARQTASFPFHIENTAT